MNELPDGWEWIGGLSDGVPRDGLGARSGDVVVYVQPGPWSCWKCGETDRLMGACITTDFLFPHRTLDEKYAAWAENRINASQMSLRGEGAPKEVFDAVWERWCAEMRTMPS